MSRRSFFDFIAAAAASAGLGKAVAPRTSIAAVADPHKVEVVFNDYNYEPSRLCNIGSASMTLYSNGRALKTLQPGESCSLNPASGLWESGATRTYVDDESGDLVTVKVPDEDLYLSGREAQDEINQRRSVALQWTPEEIKAMRAQRPREPIIYNRIKT